MTISSAVPRAPSATQAAAAVALFHSLSDGARLAIVRRLAEAGEARVRDLTTELGLAQSTVSAHVACLRDCGLVVGRPQGRQIFYSLTRPELMDLLAAAESLLTATGEATALCSGYGTLTADDGTRPPRTSRGPSRSHRSGTTPTDSLGNISTMEGTQ